MRGLGISKLLRRISVWYQSGRYFIIRFGLDQQAANQYLQFATKDGLLSILKKNGARIGANCDIEPGLVLHNCRDFGNLEVGDNCHIGRNCFLDLSGKISLEDNAVLSMQSMCITHMNVYRSKLGGRYPSATGPVRIGRDCYIGARVILLKGITVGEGSVVAAGSIVTSDIPPRSLAGGIPARVIKQITEQAADE